MALDGRSSGERAEALGVHLDHLRAAPGLPVAGFGLRFRVQI